MCRNAADTLIGATKASRSQAAWTQCYRAVEHKFAKNQCTNNRIKKFPKDIEDFASLFVELQEARHSADYDPVSKVLRSEALVLITRAEEAIQAFHKVAPHHRRAFAAFVVLRLR